MTTFEPWPKIPRTDKITWHASEKIDGTNAQVFVLPTDSADEFDEWSLGAVPLHLANADRPTVCQVFAGSKSRWLVPRTKQMDNYGFAYWVKENLVQLASLLGPGRHYGEWWGSGVNRSYDLPPGERRFSLFNTTRHRGLLHDPRALSLGVAPVPVLAVNGSFDRALGDAVSILEYEGSQASPGYKDVEGVILYESTSKTYFKHILDK